MKKVLSVSTVSRQFYLFEEVNFEILHDLGYEIHGAANYEDANARLDEIDIVRRNFHVQRSPFSFQNIKAYFALKRIIWEGEYDLIHCHAPMGGVLARLAARKLRKKGRLKVIYTAHGFHFFKGASKKIWMIYYPIEKFCARFTDVLITINREDFELAQKKMRAKKICYIPGIGVDTRRFAEVKVDRTEKRTALGIPADAVLLLSVGELYDRKNHETILRALARCDDRNIHYAIAGRGELETYLRDLAAKLGLEERFHLLGFRRDMDELYKTADIFCFPSKREGLGLGAIEAMAAGLPILTSDVQGIPDYSVDGVTGYRYAPMDVNGFARGIGKLAADPALRKKMGTHNREAAKRFDKEETRKVMNTVYREVLGIE